MTRLIAYDPNGVPRLFYDLEGEATEETYQELKMEIWAYVANKRYDLAPLDKWTIESLRNSNSLL